MIISLFFGFIVFIFELIIPVGEPVSAVIEDKTASKIEAFSFSEIPIMAEDESEEETTTMVEKISLPSEKESEAEIDELLDLSETTESEPAETEIETTAHVVETTTKESTTKIESTVSVEANVSGTNAYITDNEYNTICCVVMREAGAGSFDGCAAVAQCILDGMLYEDESATYILNNYGYKPREAINRAQNISVNDRVKAAVSAVFYQGYRVTSEMIIVYYSPANMPNNWSSWHEKQIYVCSYDGNKFFKYPET